MPAPELDPAWGYEPADWSVGICGESFWHDDCSVAPSDDLAVVEPEVLGWVYRGSGGNRVIVSEMRLSCPLCGATTTFQRVEPDPDLPDDL